MAFVSKGWFSHCGSWQDHFLHLGFVSFLISALSRFDFGEQNSHMFVHWIFTSQFSTSKIWNVETGTTFFCIWSLSHSISATLVSVVHVFYIYGLERVKILVLSATGPFWFTLGDWKLHFNNTFVGIIDPIYNWGFTSRNSWLNTWMEDQRISSPIPLSSRHPYSISSSLYVSLSALSVSLSLLSPSFSLTHSLSLSLLNNNKNTFKKT